MSRSGVILNMIPYCHYYAYVLIVPQTEEETPKTAQEVTPPPTKLDSNLDLTYLSPHST